MALGLETSHVVTCVASKDSIYIMILEKNQGWVWAKRPFRVETSLVQTKEALSVIKHFQWSNFEA